MDELKHKVLGFLNKQQSNTKIPSMGFHDDVYTHDNDTKSLKSSQRSGDDVLSVNSKTVNDEYRPDDQFILDSIEEIYFTQDNDFDASKFILQKLPAYILDCTKLEDEFKNLKIQQQCVSKRVLNMILQQQTSYTEQFRHVIALQGRLQDAVTTCRQSRTHLHSAKEQFASSLGVLANYRKRQILKGLMHYLTTIKTLYETEEHLQELLREGNYLTAILLLKERLTVASMYRHFTCIAELTKKFHDTLELSENQLDSALESICYNFDEEMYAKLQSAYQKLENGRVAIDQLNMHFTTAVHNSAFKVIHKYALFNESTTQDITIEKKQYKQLCQFVLPQDFLLCLTDLCKTFWTIITSYYNIIRWHTTNNKLNNSSGNSSSALLSPNLSFDHQSNAINQTSQSPPPIDFEDTFNQNYIKQKLENGVVKLWLDIQSKVSIFLINAHLETFQFEQFVQILSILHRLIKIGEEFCDSKSDELQEAIRKKSVNFLQNYHSSRLEELRIFFENEMWEICPVKVNFELSQLQEFKSLRHTLQHFKQMKLMSNSPLKSVGNNSSDLVSNHSQEGSTSSGNYLLRYNTVGGGQTPFDGKFDESIYEENILSGDDNDDDDDDHHHHHQTSSADSESENEELKKDFVDEIMVVNRSENDNEKSNMNKNRNEKMNGREILLTNTTLSVLRQIGKYLQMSKLLQPISLDIFYCLTQLFEYYLYSVNSCFTSDLSIGGSTLYTIKLNAVLKRISEQLIQHQNISYDTSDTNCNEMDLSTVSTHHSTGVNNAAHKNKDIQTLKISCPHLNTMVQINSAENLYGLGVRIVAVESLIFLAKQFEYLENYLQYLVPAENSHTISHFYNQTISVAIDLRKPVYMAVASQSFDLRQSLVLMSKINWEIKEVVSEHNKYIDMLLREVQIFAMRLGNITLKLNISSDVYFCIWETVAHIITHTLVEGFSNAKKCSNGGRALMQLDFTQFMSKFENITNIRPMPHKDYVERYIKAYYLPENSIEQFIKEHTEYSSKHMFGLLSCINHISKRSRQKFSTIVEEIERNR